MGRFGIAAILAALCSSLCLYGSSGSGGDLKIGARVTSWRKHSVQGQWLHCPAHGLRVSAPAITDDSIRCQRWCGSSSSSCSDSKSDERANYQVNYQHKVKTLHRELCSPQAQACISPHTHAPLPLHCLCDSGTSCCKAQLGLHRHWANSCGSATASTGGYRSRAKTLPS